LSHIPRVGTFNGQQSARDQLVYYINLPIIHNIIVVC